VLLGAGSQQAHRQAAEPERTDLGQAVPRPPGEWGAHPYERYGPLPVSAARRGKEKAEAKTARRAAYRRDSRQERQGAFDDNSRTFRRAVGAATNRSRAVRQSR